MNTDASNFAQPETTPKNPQQTQHLSFENLVISSEILKQVLDQQEMDSIKIDSPKLVPCYKVNHISIDDPFAEPSNPLFNKPYPFIQASEPNLELLKNLIYNDFRSLSDMKNEFMVLPTNISAEVAALKAKIGDALDKLERL
ncbi:hypothetical protein A2U01_0008703 [Trifolium medium]|uniref:Uncharacterized protein n=1 Tax=Trifolium medium TaxID=97028 RepID=A0A392MJZ6_9FABA|nr:hypothetical protein [Trifolium medium]